MKRVIPALLALIYATSAIAAAAEPTCAEARYLRLVDKQHGLPANEVPNTLVLLAAFDVPVLGSPWLEIDYQTALAYEQMVQAARAEGHILLAVSGYRSYLEQRYVFNRWVQWEMEKAESEGVPIDEATAAERANRYSALPGHSEHQLGTAIDVSTREISGALTIDLMFTDAGKWLMKHAHEHGFVISYPPHKEHLTDFNAEPWHLRYIGKRAAQELFDLKYLEAETSVTLNRYLMQFALPECKEKIWRPWRLLEE